MTIDPTRPAPPHRELVMGARRVGAATWVERTLFSVLGGWAPEADDPAVVLAFGSASRHAGWRAEQLLDRLPELRELPAEQLVAPATPGVERAMAALVATDGDAGRAMATYRVVLPRQVHALRRELALTGDVADAPLARTLRMVIDDLRADIEAGGAALERVLVDPGVLRAATAAAVDVEAALLADHTAA